MACSAPQYSSTPQGTVFQNCVGCELKSQYQSQKETDLQWMLYNLRYAVSYCLFGYPDNVGIGNSPCITRTACGPLQAAIQYQNLSATASAYDYCSVWDSGQVPKCSACVRAGEAAYLHNYVTILDAACLQRPAPGSRVSVDGTPFSTVPINITLPTPTPTGFVDYNSSSLTLGAKLGIAIGAVFFLLITIGLCVVWNGKRRRRRFLRDLGLRHGQNMWPSPQPGGDMFETPVSQKPLRGWEDSPVSAHTEKGFPRHFPPYSSQFSSPVSPAENLGAVWPEKAQGQQPMGMAVSGVDNTNRPQPTSKGKEKEMYEMYPVDCQAEIPASPEEQPVHIPGFGKPDGPPPAPSGMGPMKGNLI